MANDYISFGSSYTEINSLLPEYTTEQIYIAFHEIVQDNVEQDMITELDEDFYDGY